jgi:hypothetical protein
MSPPLTVELAEEMNPDWVVRRPPKTPVEDAVNLFETARSPEWKTNPLKVEEAEERSPPVNVPSPVTERVEPSWAVPEAVKVLAVLREPDVKSEFPKVELAVAKSPPWGVKLKTVVEEIFWTMSGLPVWLPVMRSVRRLAVVLVAPMVTTELTSAVVVPIATLSVWALSLTKVPSSTQPNVLVAVIPVQITFPEESVVRALEPEQVGMVATLKPPTEMLSP